MIKIRNGGTFSIASMVLLSLILAGNVIPWIHNNETSAQDEMETSQVISELLKDVILLAAGGLIGVSSSLGTNYITHQFKMQEEQIKREFAVRKEKTDFFSVLYGHISVLSETMEAYKRALGKDNAGIISEHGFVFLNQQELYDKFKKEYFNFTSFFYKSRKKGYELYFPEELANNLVHFWVFTSTLYEKKLEDNELKKLDDKSEIIMTIIEKLLGMPREK